jgi:hypothetical protein
MIEQRALSIYQPWAWAIIHAGKTIENRSWKPRYRGPLLIHASKRPPRTKDIIDMFETMKLAGVHTGDLPTEVLDEPERLKLGGVIGRVDLVDVVDRSDSPWFFGPMGLVLANPAPLPFFEVIGRQKIFTVRSEA